MSEHCDKQRGRTGGQAFKRGECVVERREMVGHTAWDGRCVRGGGGRLLIDRGRLEAEVGRAGV